MAAHAGKVVFRCPFCSSRLSKRTSWLEHRFLRRDVYCCDNPTCSASFVGMSELTHIASPSGCDSGNSCDLPASTSYLRNAALSAYIRKTSSTGDLFASAITTPVPD